MTITEFAEKDVATARALLARCRAKLSGAEMTMCERIAEGIAIETENDEWMHHDDPVDLLRLETEFAREIAEFSRS